MCRYGSVKDDNRPRTLRKHACHWKLSYRSINMIWIRRSHLTHETIVDYRYMIKYVTFISFIQSSSYLLFWTLILLRIYIFYTILILCTLHLCIVKFMHTYFQIFYLSCILFSAFHVSMYFTTFSKPWTPNSLYAWKYFHNKLTRRNITL